MYAGEPKAHPTFFISWIWLNEAAGRRYLSEPAIMQENDWASGERLWTGDWIAPFGDSLARSRLVRQALFRITVSDRCTIKVRSRACG
ncbi:toxin-activating lysine-acyltransferase [Erwinia papayae]|uniref:toxin-activating lysine-acyltransferase n=1 Tax=Erwinia papayae TaxID=206499 RepID=UPI003F5833EB